MSGSVLILGAGLGGLLCGRWLAGKGWDVVLLEAGAQPGGLLSPFEWEGTWVERGLHSAGGLGPGEPLDLVFRHFGLSSRDWYPAGEDEGFPFLRLNAGTDYEKEHILAPYRQSVWRCRVGGKSFVDTLARRLDIRYGKEVVSIENKVVTCSDGSAFEADVIISDLHPLVTMALVKDHIRPSYLHRLGKMEDGPSIFSVHCLMEPGCIPWQSHAIFLEDSLMLHFGEPETNILDLLCFEGGNPEDLIGRAVRRLPGLKVQKYCTTLSPGYGFVKHSSADFLSPVTPIPWLFLTGQNLGLHGILGTSISALNTCKSVTR